MGLIAIKLPDIGEGIAEAELSEIYVKVGDIIAEDQVIADVMTDKATVEVPSSRAGKVAWIAGVVGDTIAIGSDLVRIEVDGAGDVIGSDDEQPAPPPEKRVTAPEPALRDENAMANAPKPRPIEQGIVQPRVPGSRPLAAPSVRKAALDRGIDLRLVPGSGPAGRILHADIENYDASGSVTAPIDKRRTGTTEIKIAGLRKRIAERLEDAKARAPHITIVEEVDVSDLEQLRRKLNDAPGQTKLTLLPFIMRVIVQAVQDFPEMNAHFDDDANIVTRHAGVHMGIATQTSSGLMVPVVQHAEALTLTEAAQEILRLSEAGRGGKIKSEELTGSTITISSLGPLGGLMTTPILNRPEVAIVGVNKITKRPVWNGSEFIPRDMMNISCSFDHRIIDGWNAAQFIQRLRELLETPALAFVEL